VTKAVSARGDGNDGPRLVGAPLVVNTSEGAKPKEAIAGALWLIPGSLSGSLVLCKTLKESWPTLVVWQLQEGGGVREDVRQHKGGKASKG
jgi:hypothetical protein